VFERNRGAYAQGLRSLYMPRGVFLGKIGNDIQVFDQQDSLSFLTVSGRLQPGHRTEVLRWLQAEGFTASAVEMISENGKELLQVRKKEKHQSSQQRALQLCQEGRTGFSRTEITNKHWRSSTTLFESNATSLASSMPVRFVWSG
jgi:hypothetical protein